MLILPINRRNAKLKKAHPTAGYALSLGLGLTNNMASLN
jgi:hypothetical protein